MFTVIAGTLFIINVLSNKYIMYTHVAVCNYVCNTVFIIIIYSGVLIYESLSENITMVFSVSHFKRVLHSII